MQQCHHLVVSRTLLLARCCAVLVFPFWCVLQSAGRGASAEGGAPARAPPAAAADAEKSKMPPLAASTQHPRSNDGATRENAASKLPALQLGEAFQCSFGRLQ